MDHMWYSFISGRSISIKSQVLLGLKLKQENMGNI